MATELTFEVDEYPDGGLSLMYWDWIHGEDIEIRINESGAVERMVSSEPEEWQSISLTEVLRGILKNVNAHAARIDEAYQAQYGKKEQE